MGQRAAGVLLHPTSLPGRHGIGELGPEATAFLDFLAETGQALWQVLPLGPTGYGDSPYQCFSAFAGNPLLVSLDRLCEEGLLAASDLRKGTGFPEREVDFGPVIEFKRPLLAKAFAAFEKKAAARAPRGPRGVHERAGGLAPRLHPLHGPQARERRGRLELLGPLAREPRRGSPREGTT